MRNYSKNLQDVSLKTEATIDFINNSNIPLGDTQITWADGGAIHHPSQTAQDILSILQENLPQPPDEAQTNSNNPQIEDSPAPQNVIHYPVRIKKTRIINQATTQTPRQIRMENHHER